MNKEASAVTAPRIGLLESRLGAQAAAIVRRLGGVPVVAPALREEPVAAGPAVGRFLDRLEAGALAHVIFMTGAGVLALFREADALGRAQALTDALVHTPMVCRGPKPAGALARHGLRQFLSVPPPHTTTELLRLLEPLPLERTTVAVVHYGERNEALRAALLARRATVEELTLYEWRLPEDLRPLERFVDAVLRGEIDAIAFTSQVQARHLFQVAGPARAEALRDALRRTLVAAIGPVCAEALASLGVPADVVPESSKLGPFLAAVSSALAERPVRSRRASSCSCVPSPGAPVAPDAHEVDHG